MPCDSGAGRGGWVRACRRGSGVGVKGGGGWVFGCMDAAVEGVDSDREKGEEVSINWIYWFYITFCYSYSAHFLLV